MLRTILSRPTLWTGAAVAFAAVIVAGCGVSGTDLSDDASREQVAQGRVVYERSCASCHGIDADGTDRGPSFLNDVYEPSHHADGAFLLAVKVGVPEHHWNFGDMPPVEGVSDDEIAGIVGYIRSLQRAEGIE